MMRRSDLDRFAGDLEEPLRTFVRNTGVRLALLLNAAGQVLAQHGFQRAVDVMAIAALGAGVHASSRALAQLLRQEGFGHLHHVGREQQMFLGSFSTPAEELLLLAVFDGRSSFGLVQLFFQDLARHVAALPGWRTPRPHTDPDAFERELQASLDRLFGPAA